MLATVSTGMASAGRSALSLRTSSELVIGLGARGILGDRPAKRVNRPLRLANMDEEVVQFTKYFIAILANLDLGEEAVENPLALVLQQAVQTLDGVDIEAAVVGRPAGVVLAQR
jgi:hypothetical protein